MTLASTEAYFKSRPASMLSLEKLKEVYAGSANLCYFDAMAWMSNYWGAATGDQHDASYYFNSYYDQYGSAGFDYDSGGCMLGAYWTDVSGFAMNYFYGTALSGPQIGAFLSNCSTQHSVMLTSTYVYEADGTTLAKDANGNILTHEVVLTGVNSLGELTGYDPTANTSITLGYNNLVQGTQQGITGMQDQY